MKLVKGDGTGEKVNGTGEKVKTYEELVIENLQLRDELNCIYFQDLVEENKELEKENERLTKHCNELEKESLKIK